MSTKQNMYFATSCLGLLSSDVRRKSTQGGNECPHQECLGDSAWACWCPLVHLTEEGQDEHIWPWVGPGDRDLCYIKAHSSHSARVCTASDQTLVTVLRLKEQSCSIWLGVWGVMSLTIRPKTNSCCSLSGTSPWPMLSWAPLSGCCHIAETCLQLAWWKGQPKTDLPWETRMGGGGWAASSAFEKFMKDTEGTEIGAPSCHSQACVWGTFPRVRWCCGNKDIE